MKKRFFYLLNIFWILSLQILALDFIENKEIEKIFQNNHVKGTFVMYDPQNNTFTGYNEKRAEERFYPASTFKIFNSLIGLNVGVVKNVDEPFYKYNGEKVFLKSWAQDSSLRYAIKVSQVPAYQLLAKKIGLKEMKEEINKLNFGNNQLGDKVDQFWLRGPLKISAIEQCQLLAKLGKGTLHYNENIQKQVQDITILENGTGWILHGKTGWATSNIEIPIGWFVGWIEKDNKIYSFAINLDMKDSKNLPKREELAKDSLKVLGII
ncbi:class D beta-lactamase [Cetobacterium sp. 8H]|uniref:class D beta-lactamase n=1 Tax=Cetobacterium sp. 8H TaxID=2759681 RepID=UPI00163C11A6|nr:class D beta-lactamase [Cetobacterium sp. 8H]MBC2852117.1 class D beta-lactamase [Cetobacterium sp. 8H]